MHENSILWEGLGSGLKEEYWLLEIRVEQDLNLDLSSSQALLEAAVLVQKQVSHWITYMVMEMKRAQGALSASWGQRDASDQCHSV